MGEPERSPAGFTDVDKSKDASYYIDFLDRVRSEKGIAEIKRANFSLLGLQPGDSVLDVGCGTGEDVLSLAKIVGKKGRGIGIDNSQAMISEARRRGLESGIANAEFRLGSAYQIESPDQTFNGVIADRVFQHLEDPRKALSEMLRVVKKGGRIVVQDPDWDSFVIDSEFEDSTRKITMTRTGLLKNGKSGSRLYGMFKEVGLVDVRASGWSPVFTDYNYSIQLLRPEEASMIAMRKGLIGDEERKKWLTDLQKRGEQKRFFASFISFTVVGTRP